jgi:tetratricopeptide (TPR) repeat protein
MGAPTTAAESSTRPAFNDAAAAAPNNTKMILESSLEATYTSLVQEYLQVMCLDNATFLAERMVASFKTTNAFYLLAVCHYRNLSPQRALMVLEDVKMGNAATNYLTAKCCYDMERYGRAEEALLQQARLDYKEYQLSTTTTTTSMDEWMMETSPCPIPNGAAGLYLLGNICRRSSRKQRAMQYYRMSLQVCEDPCLLRRSIDRSYRLRIPVFNVVLIIFALDSWTLSCGQVTKLFAKWAR